jgi:hypothetical protein
MKKGILESRKIYGGGGWFINDVSIHPDDADLYSHYVNGDLVLSLEGKIVHYEIVTYNHDFYGKSYVAKIIPKTELIKRRLKHV